jgi:glycosyltransferase involved in cell wall biosynthesis
MVCRKRLNGLNQYMSKSSLLITYCFPPFPGPESYLAAKLFSSMPNSEFDVLTIEPVKPWMAEEKELYEIISSEIDNLFQVKVPTWTRFIPLAKRDVVNKNPDGRIQIFSNLFWKLSWLGAIIFKLPDPFRVFNRSLFRQSQIRLENYKNIVTWSQYNSTALVGLKLKKRFGKEVNWLAYFGDPWHENPYIPLRGLIRFFNLKMQSKTFLDADMLLFPTQEMAEYMTRGYSSHIKNKCRVLPHSFDPLLFPEVKRNFRNKPHVTFKYIGQFYGPRKPELITEGISILLNRRPELADLLRIEFIGGAVPYHLKESNLRNVLVQRPQVNYIQSLEEMSDADCLISLDAPAETNIFMSGKISDYIGAKRPIVAITNNGATAQIVREFGGWVADPQHPVEVANAIENAISWFLANREKPFGDVKIWQSLQSRKVALNFLDLIKELN